MIRRQWFLLRQAHIAKSTWEPVRLWVVFGQPLAHMTCVVWGPFLSERDARQWGEMEPWANRSLRPDDHRQEAVR